MSVTLKQFEWDADIARRGIGIYFGCRAPFRATHTSHNDISDTKGLI